MRIGFDLPTRYTKDVSQKTEYPLVENVTEAIDMIRLQFPAAD